MKLSEVVMLFVEKPIATFHFLVIRVGLNLDVVTVFVQFRCRGFNFVFVILWLFCFFDGFRRFFITNIQFLSFGTLKSGVDNFELVIQISLYEKIVFNLHNRVKFLIVFHFDLFSGVQSAFSLVDAAERDLVHSCTGRGVLWFFTQIWSQHSLFNRLKVDPVVSRISGLKLLLSLVHGILTPSNYALKPTTLLLEEFMHHFWVSIDQLLSLCLFFVFYLSLYIFEHYVEILLHLTKHLIASFCILFDLV